MKLENYLLSTALLLGLGLAGLQAQEAIPATGGVASGSGGSVSYSVGQIVYSTNSGIYGSITEGVHQAFEISGPTGLGDAKGILLLASVYPNPTTDFLTLKVENTELSDLSYQLFDIGGKLLENKKIGSSKTSITMSNYIPATYFLKVSEGRKEIGTFKIIKK